MRIALGLKGLEYDYQPVHLVREGGAQYSEAYRRLNPQQRVPTLEVGDGTVLTQSLAIMEWLDEIQPEPRLLPADANGRARVRSLALILVADVQPLQNLVVLNYLRKTLGQEDEAVKAWLREWIGRGLSAFEERLARESATGEFCHGDTPGIADCCLVPQLVAARRFGASLEPHANLRRIEANCLALPAFQRAAPENQPDAER